MPQQARGDGMPGDLLQLLYIKQLSPSDAASSKQIKLPKNDVKAFLGDLRHKQRSMVVVLDHEQVCWEFLCTCYGCQYALSRVAAFANTYQLRAGQYVIFYMDTFNRLRLMVTDQLSEQLQEYTGRALTQPLHTQTGSFLCSTLPEQPRASNAAAVVRAASTSDAVSQLPDTLWAVERLQQQQQLTAAHLSCNAAAAAIAAVIAASAPPVSSTAAAPAAEQQHVASALSNINAVLINRALHAGLLYGAGTSQLLEHQQPPQQPRVQPLAPTAGSRLLVQMPPRQSLQQQQQATVRTHPTFSSSTAEGSSRSWFALSRCVGSATTNPQSVQRQVQASAQRSPSLEPSDTEAVCWVAAGTAAAAAKDNLPVQHSKPAPCAGGLWECASDGTAPANLFAAAAAGGDGGDDTSTELVVPRAAADDNRDLLSQLAAAAAAAPTLVVTKSGALIGDLANADPCNAGDLSPACSVSPPEGSAALQVQHQEPFVDLAGSESSPTRCVNLRACAGWEACRSLINRAACPPIFKGPSVVRAAAAAGATATRPDVVTAGTGGQLGHAAGSSTAGKDTAGADVTRTYKPTNLSSIPVPSMEDLLLLHYQQEQLRNRHRQQQLDALQASFRTSHAALTNGNSKRATKLLAVAGPESKRSPSGPGHALIRTTTSDMGAGAALFSDNDSCPAGAELNAMLPLFKAPAHKELLCVRAQGPVDTVTDPGNQVPGSRPYPKPRVASQQQRALCSQNLPQPRHNMQGVPAAADWRARTLLHMSKAATTITGPDVSSNPGSPESAGSPPGPAALTASGTRTPAAGAADTVLPRLQRARAAQEVVWQQEAHSVPKPGEVMVLDPADAGCGMEHKRPRYAREMPVPEQFAAAPGLLLLLQAAKH